jgi:hypothetical protein
MDEGAAMPVEFKTGGSQAHVSPPFSIVHGSLFPVACCRVCGGSTVMIRTDERVLVAFCNSHHRCLIKWKAAKP